MADQSYCLSCGAQLIENAEFCGSCGRRRGQAGPPVSGGKSSSALLMAVMGSLGLVAVGGYAAKSHITPGKAGGLNLWTARSGC